MITRVILKWPCEARNPANGITNSDGTGNTILSSVMKKNIPKYPRYDIVESMNCPAAARISDNIDIFAE
jgi:hypothetical protein